jgi:hypothetical protein
VTGGSHISLRHRWHKGLLKIAMDSGIYPTLLYLGEITPTYIVVY